MIVIDLTRTRAVVNRLDQILKNNPNLAGQSTEEEWLEILEGIDMDEK
jgi:hypothetical protein